ncbi:MAG TPA: adenylate kinase [Clostridia bacterium]|nr:adenylate kinase [Clostridia bacterium]
MKLIFLGPPGAGKGTQAELTSQRFGVAHISTGDMLRAEMREGTKLGLEAKAYVERGELVPDDVIMGMIAERILKADCAGGYLFDGFPRTIAQAEALSKISDIDIVINLEVPPEVIVRRIGGRRMCAGCGACFHTSTFDGDFCDKCGAALYIRDDDKPETVANRIEVYERKTKPLVEFYHKLGLLRTVDASGSPQSVQERIDALLGDIR